MASARPRSGSRASSPAWKGSAPGWRTARSSWRAAGGGGRGTGRGMIAGTVVGLGTAGPGAGRFLKRGSIVALGAIERPATFRYVCTYRPPYVPVLLRYLGARYGLAVADRHITGRYERYAGDMAELGKGEILRWVGD